MSVKLYRPADEAKLDHLHPLLAKVFLKYAENGGRFIIAETIRGRAAQTVAKKTGHSNAIFGKSPHNFNPALAGDIYPFNFPNCKEQDYRDQAVGVFLAAKQCGVAIVWGGDWHSLKDLPHFELEKWKLMPKTLAP